MNKTDEKDAKKEAKALVPFSPSLLKSNIQKSVRRGDVDKAVRSAKSLILLNETDALRRLMVIPVEDAILPADYDKLAALLMRVSSKGGEPLTEPEKTLVLSIIADVARCQWRDLDVGNPDDEGKDYVMQPVKGNKENDLINALLYRSRVGTSKWDWVMLNQMARVWNRRFTEGTWKAEDLKQYATGEIVEWAAVPYATVDDIMLETVDMHCSGLLYMLLKLGWVKDLLRKEIPPEKRTWLGSNISDLNLLETVIWCMRSSLNPKRNIWYEDQRPVHWLESDNVPKQYWKVFEDIMQQLKEETDSISKWVISQQGGVK